MFFLWNNKSFYFQHKFAFIGYKTKEVGEGRKKKRRYIFEFVAHFWLSLFKWHYLSEKCVSGLNGFSGLPALRRSKGIFSSFITAWRHKTLCIILLQSRVTSVAANTYSERSNLIVTAPMFNGIIRNLKINSLWLSQTEPACYFIHNEGATEATFGLLTSQSKLLKQIFIIRNEKWTTRVWYCWQN